MGSELRVLAVGFDPGELPGCRVEIADDLLGALATVADGDVDVAVVSLDLPEGVEAVRALRERAPAVPLLALGAEEPDPGRVREAGARDALPADAGPDLVRRAIAYAAELARLETELDRARIVDERTGLPNARGLEHLAEHHRRLADRSGTPLHLVLIRLDPPDDRALEPEGREAFVAETAEVLRGVVRGSDVLARVDEAAFCVLLAGGVSGSEPLVLSRLVEAVAASNAGRREELWLSVGTATYDPARPVGIDQLMEEAGRHRRRPGS